MRHGNHKYKIGTTPAHRQALMRNLAIEIVKHGKIKTTITKCKAVRMFVEKIITISKTDTLANRRLVASKIPNKTFVQKLFAEIGPKFKDRNGGYTRIVRLPDGRVGDNSSMAFISLVD